MHAEDQLRGIGPNSVYRFENLPLGGRSRRAEIVGLSGRRKYR